MNNETERRVAAVLADVAACDAATLRPETQLFRDVGLDSAGALELLVSLEDEFEIHIRTDEARGVRTFQDLVRLVDSARS